MAYSPLTRATYLGDGVSNSFPVPFPYLIKDHVHVYLQTVGSSYPGSELAVGTAYSWSSSGVIATVGALGVGFRLNIIRDSNLTGLLAAVTAPSTLSADVLNTCFTQLLFLSQEAHDLSGILQDRSIISGSPTGGVVATSSQANTVVTVGPDGSFSFVPTSLFLADNDPTIPGHLPVSTFQAAHLLTIPNDVQLIHTCGWQTPGIGAGRYIADAAVTSSYVGFFPRSSFISANGKGFRLDPSQDMWLEQFGGVGDAVLSGTNLASGTDNNAALDEASRVVQFRSTDTGGAVNTTFSPTINFGVGLYYFSQTQDMHHTLHLKGRSRAMYKRAAGTSPVPGGTVFLFPVNTTTFRWHSDSTSGAGVGILGTSQGSCLEGVDLMGLGSPSSLTTPFHWMRTKIEMRDVGFYNACGVASLIQGTFGGGGSAEGDCKGWKMVDCFVSACLAEGVYAKGTDASGGTCSNLYVQSSGATAIRDEVVGCNTYIAPQIPNTAQVGVWSGGRAYVLTSNGVDNSGGDVVAPAANTSVWYDTGALASANASFPNYASATTAQKTTLRLSIFISGSTNQSVVIGGATNWVSSFYGFSKALGLAGPITWGSSSIQADASGAITSSGGAGGQKLYQPGYAAYTQDGAYMKAVVGGIGSVGGIDSFSILSWNRALDSQKGFVEYFGSDVVMRYAVAGIFAGWTGPNTAQTAGRTTTVPATFTVYDLALGNRVNGADTRILACRATTSGYGVIAKGEMIWQNAQNASGFAFQYCTTAGTVGSTAVLKNTAPIAA